MNKKFSFVCAIVSLLIFSSSALAQKFARVSITNPSAGAVLRATVDINANISVDFPWPVDSRRVTEEFRPPHRPNHQGIDIDRLSAGAPVRAVASGRVTFSGIQRGYGQVIYIDHGGGITTIYAHLQNGSRRVNRGDQVQANDIIGLVGSTGRSSGPHLHFEVRVNNTPVNPRNYLQRRDAVPTVTVRCKIDGTQIHSQQYRGYGFTYSTTWNAADVEDGRRTITVVKS